MFSPFYQNDWLVTFPAERSLSRSKEHRADDIMKPLQPVMNLDVVEHESDFFVHAELPGVNKEDVDITIDKGVLTISAKKENKHEEETATMHHVERRFGTVQRSIRLPKRVVPGDVRASFDNGVLEVTLPKEPPQEPPTAQKVNIA